MDESNSTIKLFSKVNLEILMRFLVIEGTSKIFLRRVAWKQVDEHFQYEKSRVVIYHFQNTYIDKADAGDVCF